MKNDNELNELDKLYISCMNCKDCQDRCIKKDTPPRGFFYINSPVDIDVLVVSKNPGHPLKNPNESEIFEKGLKDSDLFKAYIEFLNSYFSDLKEYKEKSTIFHKNLFRYLNYFLTDIPLVEFRNIDSEFDINGIFQNVAQTSLVKCSTNDEQERLTPKLMDVCYNTYFIKEIEYLKPKVILALGGEVFNFLKKKENDFNIPIDIVCIKHPSYFYKKEDEPKILEEIKKEITDKLNKPR